MALNPVDAASVASPHRATFVLSTGRCGTQWLTTALAAVVGADARVEHEPLHDRYAARRMLGVREPAELGEKTAAPILAHGTTIERELAWRDYIETGHPCWSSIPWLARRLAGQVRVVHLVRHPVPTACSWLSHGAFVPPLLPHMPVKEFIAPTDAGVSFPEYRESWAGLAPVEKALVYWAEVNAFALRQERELGVPWLRIHYEALFDPASEALARLVAFLGLPAGAEQSIDRGERVDRYHYGLAGWPEPERIARHPRVIAMAEALGYRAAEYVPQALANRFFGNEGESA